ncbi:MAG TPA: Sec-independent protein translocase TatB [Microbacterium sp.]|jgi:sec-independent protein translocase protein TatB|uniref:Sec-independent protein translocase TatB n=1 Tax=Microbacterium sp. TaxID=51671 RepID=UPI002B4597AB|nr:Sec-independent protein translocase TatB [Microbacterium sp.]HKT57108.1 Sec-independent protein translocase TatB [Microbacterium sp.]
MDFGLGFDKVVVILVMAAVFIGPKRLPAYAAKAARFVRGARALADQARERMRDEIGPEFDDVEWSTLDPRRYDPRRIIREALREDPPRQPSAVTAAHDRDGEDAGPAQKGNQ